MFAGAAREAVFSRPEVSRRVSAEFVPLAVRAPMANLLDPAGDEAEAQFYGRLKRAQAAPQGICILNGDGQVLDWVLTFADDQQVVEFLDYSLRRFRENPRAVERLASRRYQQFPGSRMPDVTDEEPAAPIHARHPAGRPCPALSRSKSTAPPGSVSVEVVGRALTPAGELSPDTVRQEHYSQDHFSLPGSVQQAIAAAARQAAGEIPLPPEFGRLCAAYAYLGHLDARPLDNPRGGTGELQRAEFQACRAEGTPGMLRVKGNTEVSGELGGAGGHRHAVRLAWNGFLQISGDRVTRVILAARGTERLTCRAPGPRSGSEVAFLPAGRPVNLDTGVRYGLIGAATAAAAAASPSAAGPSPGGQAGDASSPGRPDSQMETAHRLREIIGPQCAVFLPPVQQDLQLSQAQRKRLAQLLPGAARGVQEFTATLPSLSPEEREKRLQEFHREAGRVLGNALAALLTPDQQKRLRQVVWQQEGLFALGDPELAAAVGLTEAQRTAFAALVQDVRKKCEELKERLEKNGSPESFPRQAASLRRQQEARIAALLTPDQREAWKALLGRPLRL